MIMGHALTELMAMSVLVSQVTLVSNMVNYCDLRCWQCDVVLIGRVADGERVCTLLRLNQCHFPAPPCPQPTAVRTHSWPSHTKRGDTHTLWHTRPLGIELLKRFTERFLKVELLKARKPVPTLKGMALWYV